MGQWGDELFMQFSILLPGYSFTHPPRLDSSTHLSLTAMKRSDGL